MRSSLCWPRLAIGVLQDYYQENQYKSLSPSTIVWTQSLETGLVWFLGLPVGLLFSRYGARPLLIVGTLFHIFGLMMLSLSKQYYQVVLSQWLCSPVGAGLLYNTGKPLVYSSCRLETTTIAFECAGIQHANTTTVINNITMVVTLNRPYRSARRVGVMRPGMPKALQMGNK